MTSMITHDGGCLCGTFRYQAHGVAAALRRGFCLRWLEDFAVYRITLILV